MKSDFDITHEFIDRKPSVLDARTLYVSIELDAAIHKCFCGCGVEIVTPLSPVGWQFTYDGETVSLHPSVGTWGLPCKSHYWIRQNRVLWAGEFSAAKIAAVRQRDDRDWNRHYAPQTAEPSAPVQASPPPPPPGPKGFLGWVRSLFN